VRVGHQRAVIAAGMIGERIEQTGRQEPRVTGLLQGVPETLRQIVTGRAVEHEPDADAAVEREEVDLTEALLQAAVAREDDGQDDARVELGARQQAQLIEDIGAHVLRFIDKCGASHLSTNGERSEM